MKIVVSSEERQNAGFVLKNLVRMKKTKNKVRDHCHFTGKYRGAAHYLCNIQFKKPKFTPVVFHNLANYYSDLFIQNLGRTEGRINGIANNSEKYISLCKDVVIGSHKNKNRVRKEIRHELRFIDSLKFMTSFDKLVSNLSKDKLKQTKKVFKDNIDLISRKGVYPYKYMDKIEKFYETELPPKEEFFSELNDCDISEKRSRACKECLD